MSDWVCIKDMELSNMEGMEYLWEKCFSSLGFL